MENSFTKGTIISYNQGTGSWTPPNKILVNN